MSARTIIVLTLTALLASACALGDKRIYNHKVFRPNATSYLIAGGTDSRAVPTFIVGNPFGIAPATLANVVSSSLQSAFPGRDVTFATRRTTGLRDDVFMVVAFDPPKTASAHRLCRNRGRISSITVGESIRTLMAFCLAGTPLVSIESKVARGSGAGDKTFVLLLRDMARRMFEAKSKNEI